MFVFGVLPWKPQTAILLHMVASFITKLERDFSNVLVLVANKGHDFVNGPYLPLSCSSKWIAPNRIDRIRSTCLGVADSWLLMDT